MTVKSFTERFTQSPAAELWQAKAGYALSRSFSVITQIGAASKKSKELHRYIPWDSNLDLRQRIVAIHQVQSFAYSLVCQFTLETGSEALAFLKICEHIGAHTDAPEIPQPFKGYVQLGLAITSKEVNPENTDVTNIKKLENYFDVEIAEQKLLAITSEVMLAEKITKKEILGKFVSKFKLGGFYDPELKESLPKGKKLENLEAVNLIAAEFSALMIAFLATLTKLSTVSNDPGIKIAVGAMLTSSLVLTYKASKAFQKIGAGDMGIYNSFLKLEAAEKTYAAKIKAQKETPPSPPIPG